MKHYTFFLITPLIAILKSLLLYLKIRAIPIISGALLIISVVAGMAQTKPAKSNYPNIIYILADDLGIGDLSIYNENSKINTPNLDAFGSQGMVFTDAHTSSSVCTPTRYGILTGRYNWRTPLKNFVLWGNSPMLIKDDRLTVADMLQKHGYKTANIGKWHLGLNWAMKNGSQEFEYFSGWKDRFDFNQIDYSQPLTKGTLDLGFDYSFLISASLNMPPYVYLENDKVALEPTDISEKKRAEYPYANWIKGDISADFEHEQVLPVFVDKAISYIKENAGGDQPFFVYLPLPAPHNPILPLDPWKGKSNINPYADFVLMIDDLMGKLFETIKERGIEQNTLVIFTSDNGCAGSANIPVLKAKGHHPSYIYSGAKGSYLEGGHRVPFLVKWPEKIKSNSVCEQTICTTDFMATCADIVNYSLKGNEAEDSYSMMPLFVQNDEYQREATIHHSKTGIFAIRKGDWKLIISPNSGINANGTPEKRNNVLPENILFNLKTDVQEKNNVAAEFPEKVRELKTLLIKQIKDGRSTPGKVQKNDPIKFPWVQASFAFVDAATVDSQKKKITHSIFILGPEFTGIVDEVGKVVWDSGRAGARDGYVLPNGNILICWKDVVKEFDRGKNVVFTFEVSNKETKMELGTVVRLENGNTLITESSVEHPRIYEVNKKGEIVVSIPLQPETDNVHMQTRMARKLQNGNYLVPHLFAFAVKEYDPTGKVVKVFKTDLPELGGREAQNWPFTAIRLKNGNTLIGLTRGNKVVEMNKKGEVVWKLTNDDLDRNPIKDACGIQRLPNGNTVIASYGAKEGIKLFEVNRKKEMIWSYSGYRVHHFQVLSTNGKALNGTPYK